ncbi:KRAB [Mytilus coruscus]|uniref:KRAB n=1 Tax=Mytilus coruscus TaxID=42192 RepID=A0A6J8EQZ7_MYTCO|nr:KRAB [Mytilus coruscus]
MEGDGLNCNNTFGIQAGSAVLRREKVDKDEIVESLYEKHHSIHIKPEYTDRQQFTNIKTEYDEKQQPINISIGYFEKQQELTNLSMINREHYNKQQPISNIHTGHPDKPQQVKMKTEDSDKSDKQQWVLNNNTELPYKDQQVIKNSTQHSDKQQRIPSIYIECGPNLHKRNDGKSITCSIKKERKSADTIYMLSPSGTVLGQEKTHPTMEHDTIKDIHDEESQNSKSVQPGKVTVAHYKTVLTCSKQRIDIDQNGTIDNTKKLEINMAKLDCIKNKHEEEVATVLTGTLMKHTKGFCEDTSNTMGVAKILLPHVFTMLEDKILLPQVSIGNKNIGDKISNFSSKTDISEGLETIILSDISDNLDEMCSASTTEQPVNQNTNIKKDTQLTIMLERIDQHVDHSSNIGYRLNKDRHTDDTVNKREEHARQCKRKRQQECIAGLSDFDFSYKKKQGKSCSSSAQKKCNKDTRKKCSNDKTTNSNVMLGMQCVFKEISKHVQFEAALHQYTCQKKSDDENTKDTNSKLSKLKALERDKELKTSTANDGHIEKSDFLSKKSRNEKDIKTSLNVDSMDGPVDDVSGEVLNMSSDDHNDIKNIPTDDNEFSSVILKYHRDRQKLIEHIPIHIHHQNKEFCEPCSKVFKNVETLRIHNSEFHQIFFEKKHICSYCKQGFFTKGELQQHINRTHFKKQICKYCNKSFRDITHLRCHTINKHTKEFPFRCHICGKGECLPSAFRRHLAEHEGKEVECTTCGKMIPIGSTNYSRHQRQHEQEEVKKNPDLLFVCDICAFVAKTQNSGLNTLIYDGFAGVGIYCNAWGNEDIAKYGSPLIAIRVSIQYFIEKGKLSNRFEKNVPSENQWVAGCRVLHKDFKDVDSPYLVLITKRGQHLNLKNDQDDSDVAKVIFERFKGAVSVSINAIRTFVIHDTIFVWRKGPLKVLDKDNKIGDVVDKDGNSPNKRGTLPGSNRMVSYIRCRRLQ